MAIETSKVGAAIRGEFPIFAHTTYLNSCSQGALSHRVRAAYEEYLDGWDENGAEWAVWVERAEAARAAFARLLHAEPTELAVTTSVTQGVSGIVCALDLRARPRIVISEYEFPTVGQIAHAQELRGARGRPRAPGAGRLDPARALRGGDRRADGARLLHDRLVPHGPPPRRRRDRPPRARRRRALPRRLVPGDRRDRLRRPRARRRLRHRRHGQVPARLVGARLPLRPRPGSFPSCSPPRPAGSPTRTSSGWTSPTTRRPPTPAASTPARRRCRTSTPVSPGCRSSRRPAPAAIEEHIAGLATRLIDGLEELGATVATPRDPARRGPLVCVRSTDVRALVAALAAERIVCSERDSNLRISLHLYNVEDDVDRLLEVLRGQRPLLA